MFSSPLVFNASTLLMMIQRIQKLYLFLAIIAMALIFFFSQGWYLVGSGKFYTLTLFGLQEGGTEPFKTPMSYYNVALFLVLTLINLVWTFCSYRNLKAQRVRAVISMVFIVLYCAMDLTFVVGFYGDLPSVANFVPNIGIFLPLAALLFTGLAWRGIQRDYKLIRSVDRIR